MYYIIGMEKPGGGHVPHNMAKFMLYYNKQDK